MVGGRGAYEFNAQILSFNRFNYIDLKLRTWVTNIENRQYIFNSLNFFIRKKGNMETISGCISCRDIDITQNY